MHELTVGEERALEQLRTVQILEETISPRSLGRLETFLHEERPDLLARLEEDARLHRRILGDVLREWAAARAPRRAREEPEARLSREELLSGLAELKEGEAEVLRRAAAFAPRSDLRSTLERIAEREERTARELRGLL